jgi:hypothetical protein
MRLSLALTLTLWSLPAQARPLALIIGNNAPPSAELQTLRFADDDAAALFTLVHATIPDAELLTVLDAPTQARYPQLAEVARVPSLAQLSLAVARLAAIVRREPDDTLLVFFSGHGSVNASGQAFLSLLDGELTHARLEDLLAQIPARTVHLVIDACHAEAVVQMRGAQNVALDDAAVRDFASRQSLQHWPSVGILLARTRAQVTHEWSEYQHGVFTYELLSALRGAADVNADGRIEYSEIAAFVTASNRGVDDARAKLELLAEPPSTDLHAPLWQVPVHSAWLTGDAGALGHFVIEDEAGERLADMHPEPGAWWRLALPAAVKLFLKARDGEQEIRLAADRATDLTDMQLSPSPLVSRDGLHRSLSAGLFAASFGPTYYRAFVDTSGQVSVRFDVSAPLVTRKAPAPWAAIALWSGAAASGGVAIGFGVAALAAQQSYDRTSLQKPAAMALTQLTTDRAVALVCGGVAVAALAVGFAVFPWTVTPSVGAHVAMVNWSGQW